MPNFLPGATTIMMMSLTTGFGATTNGVTNSANAGGTAMEKMVFITAVIFNSFPSEYALPEKSVKNQSHQVSSTPQSS